MSRLREAILSGTSAASEVHRAFRVREATAENRGPIDVFGTIHELGVPLAFARLDALLGACVRLSEGLVGILITTERDLHMQRFTAAHELGHFVLEHEGSLDREVRMPGQFQHRDHQEIEADAFAAEFLMPRWLYRDVARRHQWSLSQLREPDFVYQMSLRLGVSYQAACWGLASQGYVDDETARTLVSVKPKDCKRRALGDAVLDDPWADVWIVGPGDDGATLALGPTDLVVLSLDEQAGGGYLWDRDRLETDGFTVVSDGRTPLQEGSVGGAVRRTLIVALPDRKSCDLRLVERRPWQAGAPPLETLDLHCAIGKAAEGVYQRSTAAETPH